MSAATMTSHESEQLTEATDRDDKAIATLKARLALQGYALHLVGNHWGRPEFLVMRWNLSRTLKDIEAVQAFLMQIGGTTE